MDEEKNIDSIFQQEYENFTINDEWVKFTNCTKFAFYAANAVILADIKRLHTTEDA